MTTQTQFPEDHWSRRKFLGQMAAWAVAVRGAIPLMAAGSASAAAQRDILSYYAKPAALDDGGAHRAFLAGLPSDLGDLSAAVQGMVLHQFWAPAYGENLTNERRQETHLRSAQDMLTCLNDRAPLGNEARPPAARMVGVCRHFTLLTVAALRAHGIPARARCGFATYFSRGKFEDHWVAECWSEKEARWRLVDAQLDPLQRKKLGITFDPMDVPRDRFLVAGSAWQNLRTGEARAEQFGLSFLKQYGAGFVGNNLVRDLASLNKVELLPWDVWGAMSAPTGAVPPPIASALDEVAGYSVEPDVYFFALQERYRSDPRFTVPATVTNAIRGTVEKVGSG
jgi:hypothetical protein